MSEATTSLTNIQTPPLQASSPQAAEVLAATKPGELIQLSVRSSSPDGQASLFFRGQLITAFFPEQLTPGSVLLAQLVGAPGESALKILEILPPPTAGAAKELSTIIKNLSQEIESLFKDRGLSLLLRPGSELADFKLNFPSPSELLAPTIGQEAKLQGATPGLTGPMLSSPQTLPDNERTSQGAISSLLSHLQELKTALQGESLSGQNPSNLMHQLEVTAKGTFSDFLRSAAQVIREQLPSESASAFERFASQLRTELIALLNAPNASTSEDTIARLIKTISQELGRENSLLSSREKETMRSIAKDLGQAIDQKSNLSEKLDSIIKRLPEPHSPPSTQNPRLNDTAQRELLNIATRLEQLAMAQDTINQLNPIMQALGEPALLLFPFILQGLLSHGEIAFNPQKDQGNKNKNQSKKGDSEEEDQKDSAESLPFNRVQVSVPLPGLGHVNLQLAERNKEIILHLNAENQESADFFSAQIQDLVLSLAKHDFTLTEFTTGFGEEREDSSAWKNLSEASRKFVA